MSLTKYPKFTLLFLAAFCFVNIQAGMTWMEYEVAAFENSEGGLFKTELKSKRLNKTTFGISGYVEILEDFSNDWEAELILFHSAKGNNQFVKLPYKVTKDDICNIVDGIYIKCGGARDVGDISDLPSPGTDPLCPQYKAGKYEVRQYVLAAHVVPKFLQTGYYKAQFIATKKNSDEFSTFIIHVKLY